MKNSKYHPANWSVGTRISAINFTLASVIIAVLVAAITVST